MRIRNLLCIRHNSKLPALPILCKMRTIGSALKRDVLMCFLKVGSNSNKLVGAMHKLTNVVHSGWMTKSPPEHKMQSPLKIFRAVFVSIFPQKWKQRFFVLHKPSGSLPDQYELSYYSSEQCSKKKGSIDLDQCEQIIESLDSEQYPYLLAVKTVCRSKVRTYYLATNSEDDMATWVQCLCRVCGLKQEDTPTDIPDTRVSLYGLSGSPSTGVPSLGGSSTARSSSTGPSIPSQPVQTTHSRSSNITSSTSSANSHPPPSTSPQSYLFLNECTTGSTQKHSDRYGRTDSIDSVPEYQAPPPPAKRGHQLCVIDNDSGRGNHQNSVFDVYDRPAAAGRQSTYDRPRSGVQEVYDSPRTGHFVGSETSLDDDAFYKVPPDNTGQASLSKGTKPLSMPDAVDLNATVPLIAPRRSPRSARSSLGDRPDSMASAGRPATDSYDVPPARHVSSSDYDGTVFGSPGSAPPERPPKPHSLMAQSPYQNLPTNSETFESNSLTVVPAAASKQCPAALSYDVPRASTVVSPRDMSALDMSPPAPAPRCGGAAKGHAYLNTATGLTNVPLPQPTVANSVVPAKNGEKDIEEELMYADMDDLPPSQCKPSPATDLCYADMGGGGSGAPQDLYQVPPVAPRPPVRTATATAPVQRGHGSLGAEGGGDTDFQHIWSNVRTKSFKRNNHVSVSPSIPVRPPRRPPLPARAEFASSSEDDDDLSMDGNNTHHDLSVVRMSTIPAAPELDAEPELKYLDLALDTPPDPSRSQTGASHGTPTEYREIDFVKTRALQDTKKARNMKK